nr:hypothetical protein Iba_chr01bCG5460 [Ipomoea batatas]
MRICTADHLLDVLPALANRPLLSEHSPPTFDGFPEGRLMNDKMVVYGWGLLINAKPLLQLFLVEKIVSNPEVASILPHTYNLLMYVRLSISFIRIQSITCRPIIPKVADVVRTPEEKENPETLLLCRKGSTALLLYHPGVQPQLTAFGIVAAATCTVHAFYFRDVRC